MAEALETIDAPSQIPQTMEFPNDPEGYKKTIYQILIDHSEDHCPPLTADQIAGEFAIKVGEGFIAVIPPSSQQVSTYLSTMEKVLEKSEISVVINSDWKKTGGKRQAFKYKIHKISEDSTNSPATRTPEMEDTEIDKAEYIKKIRDKIPPDLYQLALVLAERGEMTNFQLRDINELNLHARLEKLNKTGASATLHQKFTVITNSEKAPTYVFKLVIFKPHKKEEPVEIEDPTTIDELATTDTKSPFNIKRKIQELIKKVLNEADKIEMASKSKDEVTVLRTRREVSKMILSKVRDILHTLDVMAKTSELPRITDTIKEQLNSVLKSHEDSGAKELSAALRAKLGVISRT